MKYCKVKVKVIFDKKSIFHDKEELHDVYVEALGEWKKHRVELAAVERMRKYIKKKYPSVFAKKTYKLVAIGCEEITSINDDAKIVFKYGD